MLGYFVGTHWFNERVTHKIY